MSAPADSFKLVGVALFIVFVLALNIRASFERRRRREAALEQFAQWLATPQARALGLWPGRCELVWERQPSRREAAGTFSLTLYLRDPDGTHFLYIAQESGPFVKVMTPEMAKVVLKDRYRA